MLSKLPSFQELHQQIMGGGRRGPLVCANIAEERMGGGVEGDKKNLGKDADVRLECSLSWVLSLRVVCACLCVRVDLCLFMCVCHNSLRCLFSHLPGSCIIEYIARTCNTSKEIFRYICS